MFLWLAFAMMYVPVLAAPPPNDSFAGAALLSGLSGSESADNSEATAEAGEPNHAGNVPRHSVWWKWTAPVNGPVQVSTFGSNFDTLLAVYTGSDLAWLAAVESDDDGADNHASQLEFTAVSGTVYYIAVDSYDASESGNISLRVFPPPNAPSNDSFASATVVGGLPVTTSATTAGSTSETGEPDHEMGDSSRTVWFTWTAPSTALIEVESTGGANHNVALYTGPAVSSLSRAGVGNRIVALRATSGTVYRIAVAHEPLFGQDFGLSIHSLPGVPPLNDDFGAATVLNGLPADASGTNQFATQETAEPIHNNRLGGRSVWWRWTAPGSETIRVRSAGSDFDTLLAVYTGSSLGALSLVQSDDDDGGVEFAAVAGTSYSIAIDGYHGETGNISLAIAAPPPPPSNDDFASATALSGFPVFVSGTTDGATMQAGEPNHGNTNPTRSLWFTWQPAASGNVQIHAPGTVISVYTGSNLASLTRIAVGEDNGGGIAFPATAGTIYRIAVATSTRFGSAFPLQIASLEGVPPGNDHFNNAVALANFPSAASATNVASTQEPNEPLHYNALGGRTVWWRWTPAVSGQVEINTSGSDFDTILAIYTGQSLASLVRVASNDEDPLGNGSTSRVQFAAARDVPYFIAVDGWAGETGSISLQLSGPTVPESYAWWASYTFLFNEDDQATTDAERDGWTNQAEYALGLNPRLNESPGSIMVQKIESGFLTLTISRRGIRPDITYSIEGTSDLANALSWSASSVTILQDDEETLKGRYNNPQNAARGFLRLKMSH